MTNKRILEIIKTLTLSKQLDLYKLVHDSFSDCGLRRGFQATEIDINAIEVTE